MQSSPRHFHLQFTDRHLLMLGKYLVAFLLLILAIASVYLLTDIITPVVIAVFLAYLLKPLVDALENRGLARGWGIFAVFVVIIVVASTVFVLLRDKVANEMELFLGNIELAEPEVLIEQFKTKLKEAFPGIPQSRMIDMTASSAIRSFREFLGTSLASFTGIFSAVGATIIVPFLTFFLLKDSRALNRAIIQFIPNRYFEMSLSLLHKASEQLGRYIRGVLLDAAIVGIMVMIALSLIELRYAIFIGALAGMANLIPYLGPLVGGIPAVAISIIDNGDLSGVPAVLLAFAIVKTIDDVFVQPVVVSKSVELHPVTVIIGIYIGGHLGGILGMIVAVPIIAIAKVCFGILHWGFSNYFIFTKPEFTSASFAEQPGKSPAPEGDDKTEQKTKSEAAEEEKDTAQLPPASEEAPAAEKEEEKKAAERARSTV